MLIIGIIVSLIIFTLIVVIHELGHFTAARKFGVKVHEFGVWIPPKMKSLFTDKKWTKYTLNWLPIWGFVKLAGETTMFFDLYDDEWNKLSEEEIEEKVNNGDPIFDGYGNEIPVNNVNEIRKALEEKNAPYSLSNKSYFAQSCVILAWVFMNFLLSFLIFFFLFLSGVKPIWINTKIETDRDVLLIPTLETAIEKWVINKWEGLVVNPIKDSIAEKSWLEENDIVIKVNNESITSYNQLIEVLSQNKNTPITFETQDWKNIELTPSEKWTIWAYISENLKFNSEFKYQFWVVDSAKYAATETFNEAMLTLDWLGMLVKKLVAPKNEEERTEALNSVSWPIWVVQVITKTIPEWIAFLLLLAAIISINLGVFNLLPIPALDGWRFVFITLNEVSRKVFKIKVITPKIEAITHIWFFIILILLSVLIAYNDILKLF